MLFDGVCNLCNGAIQFTIKHDKKNVFFFAPLQSDTTKRLEKELGISLAKHMESMVYITEEKFYLKSDAILRMSKHFNGLWKLSYLLLIFPRFIRNFVYDIIAKNRYKWFGKEDACMVPTPELKVKFIEEGLS